MNAGAAFRVAMTFAASILPWAAGTVLAADRLPNIVLVYAADLGYADIGVYGAPRIRTPHIDRLATEGVRFTSFYVAQAVCSASRAGLLTWTYPNRVGILGALMPTSTIGIADGETTIGEMLRSRGHATAIYGKWHLGHLPPFLPTRHGFDDYLGLPYSNDMWPNHPEKMSFPPLPLYSRDAVLTLNPDQSQLTGEYACRAVAFIEANRARPFFEGGVRVPFVARWPGHIPAGTVTSEPAMTIDILPTFARLVGAPLPERPIDGLDISPLLLGEAGARSPHEALIFYYGT
jgi:arylsulfatase A